jgi:pyruvate,orthophosphate dikinase
VNADEVPPALGVEIAEHVAALEAVTGRRLGDAVDPLVLSVRVDIPAGPRVMTVLAIGLNEVTARGLARRAGRSAAAQSAAWDAYRSLLTTFATAVCGVPSEALEGPAVRRGADSRSEAEGEGLGYPPVAALQRALAEQTGRSVPHDPREQLDLAIRAAYTSAVALAPLGLGSATVDAHPTITVQTTVFGNHSPASGVGIASTRAPATGRRGAFERYLTNACLEDLATLSGYDDLAQVESFDGTLHDQLSRVLSTVEERLHDMCDVEFAVEHGALWILRCRPGRRDAAGAFTVAASLAADGLIDLDQALRRVTGTQLAELMHPLATPTTDALLLTIGIAASSGVASGQAVFDPRRALDVAKAGRRVILVRHETRPEDLPGILAAQGVLTTRGGRTSHAAVVTRGIGKPSVCGASAIELDTDARHLRVNGVTVHEGETITIDGTTARVYLGQATVTASPVACYLDGSASPQTSPLVVAGDQLLRHADTRRGLRVRANVDTPAEAARARRLGAEGIGLCRVEHMLTGERRELVERVVLAPEDVERDEALRELQIVLRTELTGILKEMDGLPVTVRVIDPPLHEFLPRSQMHEHTPMLGVRGVRLATMIPSLLDAQVRAIADAIVAAEGDGGQPHVEILIPFVSTVEELRTVRRRITAIMGELPSVRASRRLPIGSMIEVPRAALTSGQIAETVDFLSFGTNDLTQMAWGLSRDDAESALVPLYLRLGILDASPFQTLDDHGVGRLMRIAIADARAAVPDLKIGACGEHSGDPESVGLLHQLGLDYLSCSPSSLPIARLEAGRAAVGASR